LRMIEKLVTELKENNQNVLPGKAAFELYDTFGFPADLTRLILREQDMHLDETGFENEMKVQKQRSREDALVETGEWIVLRDQEGTLFTGYEKTEDNVNITRYRKIKQKGRNLCQLVFDRTPFYSESGGQAGDTGSISSKTETIEILDTVKENNLIIHISSGQIKEPSAAFKATVDIGKRQLTANNHTATHLLHYALRKVLGTHVEQKGSLVTPERLRFDFSHTGKLTRNEIGEVEKIVNRMIRENHQGIVSDGISMEKARDMGALALFGEKYGDQVRVIEFGDSVELCGGTHVKSTGSIGIMKILTEGAIAAGIRRIEAVTAVGAEEYINEKLKSMEDIAALLKVPGNIKEGVEKLLAENAALKKSIEKYQSSSAASWAGFMEKEARQIGEIRFLSGIIDADNPDLLKSVAARIRNSSDDTVMVTGADIDGKAHLLAMVCDKIVKRLNINAVDIIRTIAPVIKGGGGGQPFLAVAGGKNPGGLADAIRQAGDYLSDIMNLKRTTEPS